MQEKKYGVKRLLESIYLNSDDRNINILANILNYDERQLRQDIAAIRYVEIINKDEGGND